MTVVEGEALVNDAVALILYRVAVVAVVSGSFSLAEAGLDFVVSAVGGIAVGLVGRLDRDPAAQQARRRADRDHDLADDGVLRLPSRGRPRPVRRAGRRHRRHLSRLERAAACHVAADPDADVRGLGDPGLRPQRGAVRAARAPVPGRAGLALGLLDHDPDRLRGPRQRGGDPGQAAVRVPVRLPARVSVPPPAREGSGPLLAASRCSSPGAACAGRYRSRRRWRSRSRPMPARRFPAAT